VAVQPGIAVYIPPAAVHRARGEMKALIVTAPAYEMEEKVLV
jgi:mannose-6-phosphate isomerase-like protein (cupin superfamily)